MKRHIAMTIGTAIELAASLSFENEKGEEATLAEKVNFLTESKDLGHQFVNVTGCDNFCSVNGCLGHE